MNMIADPHQGQLVLHSGTAPRDARAVLVMVHGRGASAPDILGLSEHLGQTGMAFLAPQADEDVWYPARFTAPLADNEPWLTSALASIGRVVAMANAAGVPAERVAFLGFSQGACLALEYVARNAKRYGGVIALSGGLIGPDAAEWRHTGSLAGTPVLIGCSDVDPHIPLRRVQDTAVALRAMGANVDERIYPGMGHTVNDDEITAAQALLSAIGGRTA